MKKQKITKKVLSLSVSVLMLATMLPTNVYATETVSTPSPRSGDIEINETTFPDANFRECIERNIDKNGDKKLDSVEITNTTFISVSKANNLKGIENFTNLIELACSNNYLTSLDVSNNSNLEKLNCSNNQLESLDVGKNPALTTLQCDSNKFTSLDVGKNSALDNLSCSENKLTDLDVSKNLALRTLNCSKNNLTNLDVSKNPALVNLSCKENNLTDLDVSNNKVLGNFRIEDNQITNIDLSNNTALSMFGCSRNQLTSLDLSKNTGLSYIFCDAQKPSIPFEKSKGYNLSAYDTKFDKSKASGINFTDDGSIVGAKLDAPISYEYTTEAKDGSKLKVELTFREQTDEEKLEKAKPLAEKAIKDMTVTNKTTSQDVLDTVKNSISSLTDVTASWKTGSPVITLATQDKDGSIIGTIVLTSGSKTVEISVNKVISKLSSSNKLDEAKPLAEKAITDLAVTNETTDKNILDAVTTAITDVDGVTVSWKTGSPVITLATQDKEGSIIGTIVLTSGSKTVEISVNKVISKLSSSNKLDDAKSLVEKAIKDMTVTNKTTSQDVLDTVKNSISSLSGVTASWKVGSPTITKATSDKEGSIIGTIILTNGIETVETSVNKTIYKLIQQVIKSTGETDKVKVSGMISEHGKLYVELIEVKDGYDDILKKIDTVKNAIIGSFEARIVGGTYEGKLIVSFNIGSKYNGKTITIYHQKEDKTIETLTTVCKNGEAVITVNELSPFVLTINKSDVPQTSDSSAMMTYIGLATLTCVVGYVLKKKKEVNE